MRLRKYVPAMATALMLGTSALLMPNPVIAGDENQGCSQCPGGVNSAGNNNWGDSNSGNSAGADTVNLGSPYQALARLTDFFGWGGGDSNQGNQDSSYHESGSTSFPDVP